MGRNLVSSLMASVDGLERPTLNVIIMMPKKYTICWDVEQNQKKD